MPEYGPANAIVGDQYGTDLPLTEVQQEDLTNEKNAAKFSRTAEFKRLKDHCESRISYYQGFLPNGKSVMAPDKSLAELGADWVVANAIITEFSQLINFYEQAREIVADAAKRSGS